MKRVPRLSDKQVEQRVAEAVTQLTIAGERVTLGSILGACEGAGRNRFRRAIDRMVESDVLVERRRP